MRKTAALLSLALLSLAACCGKSPPDQPARPTKQEAETTHEEKADEPKAPKEARPVTRAPEASEAARSEAAQGINAFTIQLYKQAKEARNFCLSPFSANMALSLLHLGARGDTATTLADTLHLPKQDPHAALGSLLGQSRGGDGIEQYGEKVPAHELSVANSLWVAKGYVLEKSYVTDAVRYFQSEVADIDVNDPTSSAKKINDWTSEHTGDRIKDLVPESAIQPLTRLIIANAVYLKAFWRHPFREEGTKPAAFTTEAGNEVEVPTMHAFEHLAYGEDDDVQMLEMEYWPAKGAELATVVVLPKKATGLAAIEENLTLERFDGWLANMQSQFVDVAIPKFRTETSLSLREPLEGLGLGVLFATPDLSGISAEEGLHVDEVLQKAFIDVDEKGTEAAAATAIMLAGAGLPPEPAKFHADHPFLYVIRDKTSGAILFIGRVADPSKR